MFRMCSIERYIMATVRDYIFCVDCNEVVDFWKYGHSLEDCGHDKCHWRYVTKEELVECVRSCKKGGCFKECILGVTNPSDKIEEEENKCNQ
jgi:hypothetical protein